MRCESCRGTGRHYTRVQCDVDDPALHVPLPCFDCGGSGIAHCCAGPEPTQADVAEMISYGARGRI